MIEIAKNANASTPLLGNMGKGLKSYHVANNAIGWLIGLIACAVYIMTAEATASWWDCGEYISTAFKLQVGHPPGAPTFQLIGRIFSMFSSPEQAAHAINIMSAVCSGLTIMFLYWGITLLGKHLLRDPKNPDIKDWKTWAVFAAGVVGSLAYCFSDTFWFSAVEGEVYAMSSFFTAVVFWAILKWEEQSDDPHSLRWLVLIALLVGVAIGVHLLNLLTLPAICYVVYFKKWQKTTVWGFLLTGIISVALLAVILWGVIPGIVNVDSAIDVFFVNSLHLPFNSGTIFFFTLIGVGIVWGLWYTHKHHSAVWNAAVLSFAMLIVGYSTFFVLVIRANTNTPLNENAPKDAVAMRAYLGREQYGQTPFMTGQFYTAGQPYKSEPGYTKYVKGKDKKGRDCYVAAAHAQIYLYNQRHTGVFPRMWSNDGSRQHPKFYEYWAGKARGGRKPTGQQNLTFFNRYQMGWMYWRYFMWNFTGRQNDVQGHYFNDDGTRDYLSGNWISGIKALDEARLGPQSNLTDEMASNKARNRYYLLPLLLGLAGLVYHVLKHPKDAFIVFVMFFMTGMAIAIYLNMPPRQPRERDYAFVGSFSFFAIWIGLGVMGLAEWLSNLFKKNSEKMYKVVMPVVFVLCMAGVPCLMACENWDDHDRSQKTAARDFAQNYLKGLNKESIIITFGDNDTFPLWYAQEVEDTRTDVRILNFTLSGMYWYVEQLYNKLYESEALPFTLPKSFYGLGKDVTFLRDEGNGYMEVSEVLGMLRDNPERYSVKTGRGESSYYIPTRKFKVTLDLPALVQRGVITEEMAQNMDSVIRWEVASGHEYLYRHELMFLDIFGTNKFMRDINVMTYMQDIRNVFPAASQYSVQDGMVQRLVPYANRGSRYTDRTADYFINGVDGEPLKWGNLNLDIYVDPISLNSGKVQSTLFYSVANEEIGKGNLDKARKLVELAESNFPTKNFPTDIISVYIYSGGNSYVDVVNIYKQLYGTERAAQLWDEAFEYYRQEKEYLSQYNRKKARDVRMRLEADLQCVNILRGMAIETLADTERADKAAEMLGSFLVNY